MGEVGSRVRTALKASDECAESAESEATMPKELVELLNEYGTNCYNKGFCAARNNSRDYKTNAEKADETLKRIVDFVKQNLADVRR